MRTRLIVRTNWLMPSKAKNSHCNGTSTDQPRSRHSPSEDPELAGNRFFYNHIAPGLPCTFSGEAYPQRLPINPTCQSGPDGTAASPGYLFLCRCSEYLLPLLTRDKCLPFDRLYAGQVRARVALGSKSTTRTRFGQQPRLLLN